MRPQQNHSQWPSSTWKAQAQAMCKVPQHQWTHRSTLAEEVALSHSLMDSLASCVDWPATLHPWCTLQSFSVAGSAGSVSVSSARDTGSIVRLHVGRLTLSYLRSPKTTERQAWPDTCSGGFPGHLQSGLWHCQGLDVHQAPRGHAAGHHPQPACP